MAPGALLACFLAALAGDVDSPEADGVATLEALPDSASPEAVDLGAGEEAPIATATTIPAEAAIPGAPAPPAAAAATRGDPTAGTVAAEPELPPAPLEPAPAGPPLADAAPLLLGRVERGDGTALERLVEPSGDIVEHEVNAVGTVQSCRVVGSLFGLRMIDQRPASGGEFVHVVRDDATGALVRFAIAADGEARAVAVLARATR